MKTEVILKYLSYFCKKKPKGKGGFTLIELLVVVIIMGILAAVALPNLLAQTGKAREVEAKNAIGTINRGQHAIHYETGFWSGPMNNVVLQSSNILGVAIISRYYKITIGGATNDPASTVLAEGINSSGTVDNGKSNGTRDYSGMVEFNTLTSAYTPIMCQASFPGTIGLLPFSSTNCDTNHTQIK